MHSAPLMLICILLAAFISSGKSDISTRLSQERVVFQTKYGDIEFAFLPEVAPVTVKHIFELVTLGCYQSNHIFRVDRGFVAQTADVAGGRSEPMNTQQRAIANQKTPLEVVEGVKHHAGSLSMGRYDDPNSATSSFSFLLGDAPHLDMKYTIFAQVTQGMETLRKLETLPTRREGIFVMPLERITITGTYWYRETGPLMVSLPDERSCETQLEDAGEELTNLNAKVKEWSSRYAAQDDELQRVRKKCLPA